MKYRGIIAGLVGAWSVAGPAGAALTFVPATGHSTEQLWAGTDAAHFAVDGDDLYIYGAVDAGAGEYRNVVQWFHEGATVPIAFSPEYSGAAYSPDAITALHGAVYWAHVSIGDGATTLFKTTNGPSGWETTPVFDAAAGVNVYSLSTDGQRVFGVGTDSSGTNVAFYVDDDEDYQVFAELPAYSGGSGFDPNGNFFAGALSDDFLTAHMYAFSASQVADRISGVQAAPYAIGDAVDHVVPGNGSPVMESDGTLLYGVAYDGNGTSPYAYDLDVGLDMMLGTLSGADITVASDMYYRDGGVLFLAKDGWGTGDEAVVYRIVPEPTPMLLLAVGAALLAGRRRCKPKCRSRDEGMQRCRIVTPLAGNRMRRRSVRLSSAQTIAICMGVAVCLSGRAAWAESPFAAAVIDFAPAPGQYVNDTAYDDPSRALGSPLGDDPSQPNNTSLVSLGGFGGVLTLAFDHTVRDDPANPFGLDAIVYGNAFWSGGDPTRRWAECGVIEISRDANSNGVPDDPWFVIPGSHLIPGALPYEMRTWDADTTDDLYPPAFESWIPSGRSGVWTSAGYRLPAAKFDRFVIVNTNGPGATVEDTWGYADLSPTRGLPAGADATDFYTRPDNPFVVGTTPGAGGGDAFDIAWAVDGVSGSPAGLEGFDYLRVRTAVDEVSLPLGELSTEIDAVADVAEGRFGDAENDGDIDLADQVILIECLAGPQVAAPTAPCRVMDFDQDGDIDLADVAGFQAAYGAS